MANKEIHAIYDNGTMIWPATTTTAIVDPTSRESLPTILNRKRDKPLEITDYIPSRLNGITSSEDAITLTTEEVAQLQPLLDAYTSFQQNPVEFTFNRSSANPIDLTNTYSWDIIGLPGWGGRIYITFSLCYQENGGVKSYWIESSYENLSLESETQSKALIVNFSIQFVNNTDITVADKTITEIYNAYAAGKDVIGKLSNTWYYLQQSNIHGITRFVNISNTRISFLEWDGSDVETTSWTPSSISISDTPHLQDGRLLGSQAPITIIEGIVDRNSEIGAGSEYLIAENVGKYYLTISGGVSNPTYHVSKIIEDSQNSYAFSDSDADDKTVYYSVADNKFYKLVTGTGKGAGFKVIGPQGTVQGITMNGNALTVNSNTGIVDLGTVKTESEVFIITVTGTTSNNITTYSADKTITEILAANTAGKSIRLILSGDGGIYHPMYISSTGGLFVSYDIPGHRYFKYVVDNGTTTWTYEEKLDEERHYITIDMNDLELTSYGNEYGDVYLEPATGGGQALSLITDGEDWLSNLVLLVKPTTNLFPDSLDFYYGLDYPIWIPLTPVGKYSDFVGSTTPTWPEDTYVALVGETNFYGVTYRVEIGSIDTTDELFYTSISVRKVPELEISTLPAYVDAPGYPTVGDSYDTGFGKLNKIIADNEEITAAALLDLNSRVLALSSGGGGNGGGGMVEITYSNLVTLKSGGNLTPGLFYKITDYTCTTTQTDTQSAGHVFDIIVLALSGSTLSEKAWADHHEGDTYFSNCKLGAWELKYCLDNDTTRFEWADTTNGKGVIYWMKDEWENECPYDFKNIQFKANISNGLLDAIGNGSSYIYTFTWVAQNNEIKDCSVFFPTAASSINGSVCNNIINSFSAERNQYSIPLISFLSSYSKSYYFGGIRNNYIGKNSTYISINGDQTSYCENIVIGDNCSSVYSAGAINIRVGNNCSNISFGTHSYNITIGDSCSSIRVKHFGSSSLSQYFKNITIEPEVKYIALYPTTNSTNSSYFQNILVKSGVSGSSSSWLSLTTTPGNSFQTIYKPANSVEISV